MHNRIFLILGLLFFIFSRVACAETKNEDIAWAYERVSSVNLLGKRDSSIINEIRRKNDKFIIKIAGGKLNVESSLLKERVCSADYVIIKATPLSYFMSEKTVHLYEQLLISEGMHISKKYLYLNRSYLISLVPNRTTN